MNNVKWDINKSTCNVLWDILWDKLYSNDGFVVDPTWDKVNKNLWTTLDNFKGFNLKEHLKEEFCG